MFKKVLLLPLSASACLIFSAHASDGSHHAVSADVLFEQNLHLHQNTVGKGFGPQAPRDIDAHEGRNRLHVAMAPATSTTAT